MIHIERDNDRRSTFFHLSILFGLLAFRHYSSKLDLTKIYKLTALLSLFSITLVVRERKDTWNFMLTFKVILFEFGFTFDIWKNIILM